MKVYLDDERETPEGWVRAYWPEEVIQLLQTGEVTHPSLDHDLGDDSRGTGYDVLLWLERAVALHSFRAPAITVHSAQHLGKAEDDAGRGEHSASVRVSASSLPFLEGWRIATLR